MSISTNIINQVTVPVRASDYHFMKPFDSKLVGTVGCKTCLAQQRADVSPISHISCGGDILTPAPLWAQIVNSRFSMPKHCHVFIAAEACKRYWLGVGARDFLGLARSIFVVRRQVSLSQPGMGGLWSGHC